ncbi:MAG: type II secretion system F family protein [Lachnospiraceae bacterium]|nr:type II secretion system F family protein [Lachnospiraceae bacterium]
MLILFICLAAVTALGIPYRLGWKWELSGKEHPLRFFYGTAALLLDLFMKIRRERFVPGDAELIDSLQKLNGRNRVQAEWYFFHVKRITTVLLGLLAAAGLAALLLMTGETQQLTTAERPNAGESAEAITAVLEAEDETEQISLVLSPVQLTETEVTDLFEQAMRIAWEEVLGENESLDSVRYPLNLVDSVTVEAFSVQTSWSWDCEDALEYDGTPTGISEKTEGTLYLTLTWEDRTRECEAAICVLPTEEETAALADLLQKYLDEENIYDKEIALPEELDGEAIALYSVEDSNWLYVFLIGVAAATFLWFRPKSALKEELKRRDAELQRDYSEIVLRIALLQEAGMSLANAWERLVVSYENKRRGNSYMLKEMLLALRKMQNGMSEVQAFIEFGKRCGGAKFARLSGLLEQNVRRGNRGFAELLYREAEDAMQEEKNNLRRRGEELDSKLLLPMGILLVLVMALVLVPAFSSMNGW